MKNYFKIITFITITFIIFSCKTTEKSVEYKIYKDSILIQSNNYISIKVEKGEFFNHPTFVFWKEDMEGNFIETIFITKSYASGIFGHQMVGDTMWLPNSGLSYQPAALPYWTYKKGLIDGKYLVPTPEHPYIDAYSGATPTTNFELNSGNITEGKYRILCEVNQTWDWNEYWTNDKFSESEAYKHSAQPSIIYAVTITDEDSVFYLNPIGHGSPTGEDGKLYTDLSTLTTAKNIFKTIKVTIEN